MENTSEIKVSVIIPVYNASDYLRPALDSVLGGTLDDIEVICVDDGSTDNSLEILKEYQDGDHRVRILTETNAGPAIARNSGIKRARGEYLAFLDADDFYEPAFLEELYTAAKRDSLDIVISRYDLYNSNKARFEPSTGADHSDIFKEKAVTSRAEYPDLILSSTVCSAWNKLFRRDFIIDTGLSFLNETKIYEDVYFVVIALAMATRVGKVHNLLMHHRIHSEQTRARLFSKQYKNVPLVFVKIKEFLISHGVYSPLSRSYLNLSADRSLKLFNLLPNELKDDFWNSLHRDYFDALGWSGKEEGDFDSPELFDFTACLELYNYDEYKKELKRRESRSDGDEHNGTEHVKRRKRIRGFFLRIFGKNK